MNVLRARATAVLSAALGVLALQINANAAELHPETVAAWNQYISDAESNMNQRVGPGKTFLWSDEKPGRALSVRKGTFAVAPGHGSGSVAVPNGLIHHWVGAVFIPDTSLDQVVTVTRNYDRYKDYFNPEVTDSRVVAQSGDNDEFSVRWMTKILFVSTGLDTQCRARSFRVDDRRYYKTSYSTQIQEIQNYGSSQERKLAPDQGDGFIWRLYSINRYEERDGGVYLEIEAMALTRDIPSSVRMIVTPVVRRISRNSLIISLRHTKEAVLSTDQSQGSETARVRNYGVSRPTGASSFLPASK